MGKLLGRFFVFFTIILISFNGYSSQIFIIWPWYGREVSVDLLKLTVPFNYVFSISLVCIESWSEPGRSLLLAMLWWNYYCKRYKPPRSHHCKDCQTCVCCSLNLSLCMV